MPSERQRDEFRDFMDWAACYGLRMPVSGDQVATYLLEMLADGASVADIGRAANAIAACYSERRRFLDLVPIKAALRIAAAQLSPDRILN
jgi:hypothetical protein